VIWETIVVTGALGGVAGMVAWVATRGLEKKNKPLAIGIRTGVVAAVVPLCTGLVAPRLEVRRARAEIREAGLALFGNGHVADIYADALLPIVKDPRFMDRLEAADGAPRPELAVNTANPAAAALTASGMMRLPLDTLTKVFDVKRAMARSSHELCAGFWKGQIPSAAFSAAIKGLTEAEQLVWIESTVAAMTLELGASGPPAKIASATAGAALKELAATLPGGERAALSRALQAGAAATTDDACGAFLAIAEHAGSLPAATGDVLVRMVATPDAIGN
jgi:hypothetical protein